MPINPNTNANRYANIPPSFPENSRARQDVVHQDINFSFAIHPATKDLMTVTNTEAIKNSIRNLILANRGDFLYDDAKFTNIKGSLFELVDSGDIELMKMRIDTVLTNFEPRVRFVDVAVEDNLDENRFGITVYYTINNIQDLQNVKIFLRRVR